MQSRVTSGGSSIPKRDSPLFLTQGGGGGEGGARISIINLGGGGEEGGGSTPGPGHPLKIRLW